ncbi:hypothetical protein EJB05_11985, partial [Eragrostis curvula]
LNTILEDDGGLIYGAVFEHHLPLPRRHPSAPRYVVAFRGTVSRNFKSSDMQMNLMVMTNNHHKSGRYRMACYHVGTLLDATAGDNGSAGDVPGAGGQHAARRGRGEERPLRHEFVVKAALGKTVRRSHEKSMSELFDKLAPWVPELYVHERDFICQGFIDYFELRQKILRLVAEVAMKMSFRDMWISLHNTNNTENDEEPRVRPHLLPSARLWKNSSEVYPHGLRQWWQPDSSLNLVQSSINLCIF